MAYDYDKLYGETREALGPPTKTIVDFFDRYDRQKARILDVGCGQDLMAAAHRQELSIEGIVANIVTFEPQDEFDVILLDRTLHMLPRSERLSVLNRLLARVGRSGWLLIADEASNIADFQSVIASDSRKWTTELQSRGYLFVRRL